MKFNTNTFENEPSSVKVFPNPTDELLTFVIENGNEVMEDIEIIDLSGRVVIVIEQRKNLIYTMPVASLESGIYFYQVKTNQQTMVGKFVKL
ncbi:MAG: T9SS type A sorting domain-containing protein [Saprospiraceae bacterium]|nr:T9SS type A sorting domain-containing protein [Saprospiraceae bacterium]